MKFAAHDGDGPQVRPETRTFQINVISSKGRSQFLKIGEIIDGMNMRLLSFSPKATQMNGPEADASELTLSNGFVELVLKVGEQKSVLNAEALLRDDFAPASDVKVNVTQDFELKAEPGVRYRLLGLTPEGAVIGLPNGKR